MTQFARLDPLNTSQVRDVIDIPQAAYDALAGNPKRDLLRSLTIDAQPTPSALQAVERGPYVIEPLQVRQTWTVRAKTRDELSRYADAADVAALRVAGALAMLDAEVAGTSLLTVAQFRALVARALRTLIRSSL